MTDVQILVQDMKAAWRTLSKEQKILVATKAQVSIGYINFICNTKELHRISKDTIYDISVFANEIISNEEPA